MSLRFADESAFDIVELAMAVFRISRQVLFKGYAFPLIIEMNFCFWSHCDFSDTELSDFELSRI